MKIMTDKALKHLCLLIVCIMAVISITSCSSDDNPSEEVIPQLKQKLIGGIWLAGKVDKGNILTIHLAGDQMTMVGHNFSRVYTRQASTESE